jgi:hypothetical protein
MIHSWPGMEHEVHVNIRDEGTFGYKVPECLQYVTFVHNRLMKPMGHRILP